MHYKIRDLMISMILTLLTLIFLETMTTALLPSFGIVNFYLPFDVLIVLYLGFKMNNPYSAIFIFFIEVFHGFFTIEGWAIGTFAGILVSMLIAYLREIIHLSSAVSTILMTEAFQIVWFALTSFLIYLQVDDMTYLSQKFAHFIPESLIMAFLSPLAFKLLDKIWSPKELSSGEMGVEL